MERTRFAAGLITNHVARALPAGCESKFQDAPSAQPGAPMGWYIAFKDLLDRADALETVTAEDRPVALEAYRKVAEAHSFWRALSSNELSEGRISDWASLSRLKDFLNRTEECKPGERVAREELRMARDFACGFHPNCDRCGLRLPSPRPAGQ